MYDPSAKGFDARLSAIDRAQLALLRELAAGAGRRLILKGGMAMRAAVGSMRLTKDIDFDRSLTLSASALKSQLRSSLKSAAAVAGVLRAEVEITKDTETTCRARLLGQIAGGAQIRFEVEVSGRREPRADQVRTIQVAPPPGYAMAPFAVQTYSHGMLAAMKIAAAMSPNRSAPRDILDLHDLMALAADPSALLADQDAALLKETQAHALGKLSLVDYALAESELLPYLPADTRAELSQDRWEIITLEVAEAIERWAGQALRAQAATHPLPNEKESSSRLPRRGR